MPSRECLFKEKIIKLSETGVQEMYEIVMRIIPNELLFLKRAVATRINRNSGMKRGYSLTNTY